MSVTAQDRSDAGSFAGHATRWETRLPLTLRLAMRELRSGLAGFGVLIACIALGVAVITGVGALADALLTGFAREGRVLLGGDVLLRRVHARITPQERNALAQFGTVAETAAIRTMARTADGGDQTLAEIKAVDDGYPLLGTFALRSGKPLHDVIGADKTIVVAPSLLDRLGVDVGETITAGGAALTIGGVIANEPDKISARLAFGPRIVMSMATLEAIGLVRPGTLVNWQYGVVLNDAVGTQGGLMQRAEQIRAQFGPAGFSIADSRNPSPQITSVLDRLRQFLTLLGLTALLVGGVGVANAVATFVDRRRGVIAAYKSLGASRAQVFRVFLVQVMLIAGIGIAIGLAIGLIAPLIAAWGFGNALPFRLEPDVGWRTVGVGVTYGSLVALLFVLWPLGQAERVRPAELFRNEAGAGQSWPSLRAGLGIALAAGLLVAFTVWTSGMPRTAFGFLGGSAVILAMFWGLGILIERGIRSVPRPPRPALSLALTSIGAPGGMARSVMLSLGAGLSLLVMVALIDRSLTAELQGQLPENSPDYFALDIPKGDVARFTEAFTSNVPGSQVQTAPMLRGRIVALNGVPVEQAELESDRARMLLNGDRGLSYAAQVPDGTTIVSGQWWPEDYAGPPLVSFVADFARRFGLTVGDTVTVNVLGRRIEARVANLREVQWESLRINFSMVFPPSVLAAAPHNLLATVRFPDTAGPEARAMAARAVGRDLPQITLVSVRDAIDAFGGIFERIMIAVRAAGSLTLLAGALVLAGALATAQRRRIMQAVILKCIGATRGRLLRAHIIEYGLLALVAGLLSILIGTIAAWIIATMVLGIGFTLSWTAIALALAGAVGLVLAVGSIGTWRILSARPVPYLRGL